MHLAFIVLIEYIVFSKKRKDLFLIFQFYLEIWNICFTILNSFKMFSYFQYMLEITPKSNRWRQKTTRQIVAIYNLLSDQKLN